MLHGRAEPLAPINIPFRESADRAFRGEVVGLRGCEEGVFRGVADGVTFRSGWTSIKFKDTETPAIGEI